MEGTSSAQVKVYKEIDTIPTYRMGKNVLSPMFYTGRAVQGAQGKIYPYPLQTNLTDSLVDVAYEMICLENKYIKVRILPAFGGKVYSAVDKTNGHELFHVNSVIKPALIGTLGAWVSGGIEWCFPNHHRTTTMLPSDYRIVKNEDGSITVWTGETEKTARLRGIIGVTLHPNCSYIQADYRISNMNTTTRTFLFWANVAVTANKHFRTFWPPSQRIAVFHNNSSFTEWPISHQVYQGTDYTDGVDLTWWKNHPNPVSFFMWNAKGNFVGGYDYSKDAGIIHVGGSIKNKTSKLWEWGPGLQGQNARRMLTDDGQAYVELMTGTFSNNQPDYSWIIPHSVKDATNFWYPIRELEVVKKATKDAAVTLQMKNEKTIFYGFNTTKSYKEAHVTLKYRDSVLRDKIININPDEPFTDIYTTEYSINKYRLKVALKDKNGNLVISYSPYKPKHHDLPEPQERIKSPQELKSVEDLYLTGRYVEQFHRAGISPDDYYMAALKKSPNDYRVNIALGIRRIKQTKFKEALSYLKTAAHKLRIKYHQPREGKLYYYRGLAQKGLGQIDEAYRSFGRSTWYYQWVASGNFELAQIDSKRGDYKKALKHIKDAYATDTKDGRINVLYSMVLRELGKNKQAMKIMNQLLAYDPLYFPALFEKSIIEGDASLIKWQENMQNIENNYLEVATHYMNAGFYKDGITLLSEIKTPDNPLTYYYLSWFYTKLGNEGNAEKMHKLAKKCSLSYVFPYRQEAEQVLDSAILRDAHDTKALYLLGNLLFDNRPKEAMAAWKKASKFAPDMAIVWRNLAFGANYFQKDPVKAISYLTKAIALDNSYPHWYDELYQYYDASGLGCKALLAIFENNIDVVQKDVSAPKEYVKLLNLNGEYDKAKEVLGNYHFRTWEGGRAIHKYYVNTYVLNALELIDAQKYQPAIQMLEKALLYPTNLEVGKSLNDGQNAMIYYFMGSAYSMLGENDSARKYYQKSVKSDNGARGGALLYFQGSAMNKLGDSVKAKRVFNRLIKMGKKREGKMEDDGTSIAVQHVTIGKRRLSNAYYLEGLGYLGLGNKQKAIRFFKSAIKLYKSNLWAREMIDKVTLY